MHTRCPFARLSAVRPSRGARKSVRRNSRSRSYLRRFCEWTPSTPGRTEGEVELTRRAFACAPPARLAAIYISIQPVVGRDKCRRKIGHPETSHRRGYHEGRLGASYGNFPPSSFSLSLSSRFPLEGRVCAAENTLVLVLRRQKSARGHGCARGSLRFSHAACTGDVMIGPLAAANTTRPAPPSHLAAGDE